MELPLPIPDRRTAGRALAEALKDYAGRSDVIVLALPRGGMPVAAEIARALEAPLDLMLVRKLGVPGYPELAMGAIASGGVRVMNDDVVRGMGISQEAIERVAEEERHELERRARAYRGDRPWPDLKGRCVILVDDGLATGATMHAAIDAVRAQHPDCIVVAVPVAPPDTIQALRPLVDEVVCPHTPEPFQAIGLWYRDFSQTPDEEVIALMEELAGPVPVAAAPTGVRYVAVPEADWPDYCETFGRQHHGWLVNLWQVDTQALESDRAGALASGTLLAGNEPLQAVHLAPDGQTLAVEIGPAGTARRFTAGPVRRLWRERVDESHEGMRIDQGDGRSLLIEFRAPARPEELDGLAPSEL